MAKQIAVKNSGSLDGPTAVRVVRDMAQVDPTKPNVVTTWTAKRDEKSGGAIITLTNGTVAKLAKPEFERVMALRKERQTAAEAALAKARDDGARSAATVNAIPGAIRKAGAAMLPTGQTPTTGPFRKDTGPRVDLYREGTPVAPAQDLERINMARRAAGQLPITLEQLQGQ
jgi:hypothetical protein